jgi:hypothetical protein
MPGDGSIQSFSRQQQRQELQWPAGTACMPSYNMQHHKLTMYGKQLEGTAPPASGCGSFQARDLDNNYHTVTIILL